MCGAETSSAWHRRWAKDPSRSPSCIRRCASKRKTTMAEGSCAHIGAITTVKHAKRRQCEECVKIGSPWVHLRTCQECGTTRCCDDSPNRYATEHARASKHPVIASRSVGSGGCIAIPTTPFLSIEGSERDLQ